MLEDASRTGYLVYPPLHQHEAIQIRYLPENVYRLSFFVDDASGVSHRAFVTDIHPSAGTGGVDEQEIQFIDPKAPLDHESVLALVDALTTNVNAPPGGVGLRGAYDFVTPEGWDTLYLGVLNEIQRPAVPTLAVRVETDWYAQNTEFRYVLQPGDVLSAAGSSPIGQVCFLSRHDIELVEGSAEDAERFRERQRTYWEERATKHKVTNFGALYTYHYRDLQKERRTRGAGSSEDPR